MNEFEVLQHNLNTVWTCLAAFMVFFMQAGFALVEMGLTRAKNAINIIMKNLMDFSIGSVLFFFIGAGLMFGESNGFFGTNGLKKPNFSKLRLDFKGDLIMTKLKPGVVWGDDYLTLVKACESDTALRLLDFAC